MSVTRVLSRLAFIVVASVATVLSVDPSFDVPVVNVTVVSGKTAVLPCAVKNLGKYKVVWTDHRSILLTLEELRIIDDDRISIERHNVDEWNLQIREIKHNDRGHYICQINTEPVRLKHIILHVLVPAKIIYHLSSQDIVAREGDTVTLVCNVTGVPHPTVTWFRQPSYDDQAPKERIGVTGEVLIIHNVSRYCDDVYECIAFNGVPPAVKKQIRVMVEFAPEILLPNTRIGQARGKDTILECKVTAYPQGVFIWEKNGREIQSNFKYGLEAYDELVPAHTVTLSLRIRSLDERDYGNYTCVASNQLGKDEAIMALYDHTVYLTTTTTQAPTTSTLPNIKELPWTTEDKGDNKDSGYETGKETGKHPGKGDVDVNPWVPSSSPQGHQTPNRQPPRRKPSKNGIRERPSKDSAATYVFINSWLCILIATTTYKLFTAYDWRIC